MEREFEIGNTSYDYKRLLAAKSILPAEPAKKGARFKIIVEDGEVFFQCIDSFEDVFKVSKELVEHLEITEILDPFLFDNHKDIINALFLVYYELSNNYVDEFYHKPRQAALVDADLSSDYLTMQEKAERKLRLKFNLSPDEQRKQQEQESLRNRLIQSKL